MTITYVFTVEKNILGTINMELIKIKISLKIVLVRFGRSQLHYFSCDWVFKDGSFLLLAASCEGRIG